MSQEEISCHRKKFPVTGRHFLSKKEFSSQNTKFQATGRNFLLQEEIFCHRKKFPVTESNFLSKEKNWLGVGIVIVIFYFFSNCDMVEFIIILAYYPKPLHFRSNTSPLPEMCLWNT